MKVTGKKGLGDSLGKLLRICFWGGIFVLIALPIALYGLGLNLNATAFVIYPNGIVLLIITHKFIKLFDSLKNENPFCDDNINIFKSTSKVAIVGAILWLLDLMYQIILVKSLDLVVNAFLIFLSILFLGVAIALYILSELFKEAVNYKQENELTI